MGICLNLLADTTPKMTSEKVEVSVNPKQALSLGTFIFCIILYNMITPNTTIFTVTIMVLLLAFFWTILIELIIIGVVLLIMLLIMKAINS